MTYKVEIVEPAQADMRKIAAYIANDLHNLEAAVKRIDLIDKKNPIIERNAHTVSPCAR